MSSRQHFDALTVGEKQAAVRQLARDGYSDHGISAATNLSVEMVRRVLADQPAVSHGAQMAGHAPRNSK
jgi:hypothetical protein